MIWVILGTAYVVAAVAFYSVSMRTAQAELQLVIVESATVDSRAA